MHIAMQYNYIDMYKQAICIHGIYVYVSLIGLKSD